MRVRLSLAVLALLIWVPSARAETVTLFRVFLNDGTTIVSYGEYARVGDRVIFSMPIGAIAEDVTTEPNLHVVNIPAAAINWPATAKYAEAARYTHYVATNAEADYASLTGEVAAVLNAIVINRDPQARLRMAVDARRRLASWPRDHFGYRAGDVREILGMLDEAISSMRAAAGETAFAIDLVAESAPLAPAPAADLLPNPTAKESIAQAVAVAKIADIGTDRVSLLKAVVAAIDNPTNMLPGAWAATTRSWTAWALKEEALIEKRYGALASSMLKRADVAAAQADVRGVEGLIHSVRQRDARLGGKRPDTVNALLADIQVQLDAARQLRLVRDRWKERVGEYRAYLSAIAPAINALARAQRDLDSIKRLAGSEPVDLVMLLDGIGSSSKLLSTVSVPEELSPAHALLVSALTLADNAVRTRRSAVASGEIRSAWDASSAAAGSMTLFAKAQEDMEAVVKLPQAR
ncbi:MAG: hypothetical protein ND807_04520 [Vicinamibacterales bacterium]|nr:hypothetical protein [Vicinamibacterales bacterium]